MAGFLDCPQSVVWRRALFQIHLWVGVAAGLYVFLVSITGAALVFRIDLQRLAFPELLTQQDAGPATDIATVLASVQQRYRGQRVVGVDAPTVSRPTYLSYVVDGALYRTVMIDPSSARVLGELSANSAIATLQALHFNLLMGRTGTLINGIGALCLLCLALSGMVIWWQGRRRWTQGLRVWWHGSWPRFNWDLHSAIGIWSCLFVVLWATTALSFTFPQAFRHAVGAVSPLTIAQPPTSDTAQAVAGAAPVSAAEVIHTAQRLKADAFIARVVLPVGPMAPFQVYFSARWPTPLGPDALTSVYFDRYWGQPIAASTVRRTAGDAVIDWVGALHVGNFAGQGVKVLWLVMGLGPPVLFVTGVISWWRRVIRPQYRSGLDTAPPTADTIRRRRIVRNR